MILSIYIDDDEQLLVFIDYQHGTPYHLLTYYNNDNAYNNIDMRYNNDMYCRYRYSLGLGFVVVITFLM